MAGIGKPTDVRQTPNALVNIQRRVLDADVGFRSRLLRERLDKTFTAFVAEFRADGWHYSASPGGGSAGRMAMTGDPNMALDFPRGVLLDCARLCNMLAMAFLHVACKDDHEELALSLTQVNWDAFVTKKLGFPPPNVRGEFSCIDPSVQGNVKRAHEHYAACRQCLFSEHHALKVGAVGLIYDPALVAIYRQQDDIVDCYVQRPSPITLGNKNDYESKQFGPRRRKFIAVDDDPPFGFAGGFLAKET